MGETEEFNILAFEKRLMNLKDTQEAIQGLSSWCLKQREHHKKIVASWLNVLKRVKVEQRLVLFYLANDVIQYSKRKNYEFVESWGLNLQKATPLVRDDKVRHKILRIFKIWEQRSVYDEEFLSDLTGLLSAGAIKKTDDDPLDFQPQQLVNKIKQCTVLEADTDLRLKYIHENKLQLSDTDALLTSLKDRSNKDDVEKELNEGIQCVERYTQALQREIVAREALLALLTTANQYYSTQRGEVKVVAYAYKNFGARVRQLKRKLDELIPTLPEGAPSPPQRDEDVPSPGPDEDLDLPNASEIEEISYNIDRTFNTSMSADGSLYNLGLSSFLSSDNPLSLFSDADTSANKIEVINSRPNEKQDFDINNFLKTFVPNDSNAASDNNSVGNASQKSNDTLPGLDLLTPDSTGNPPPPTSFYGTMDSLNDDPEPYIPELNTQWNSSINNQWSIPASFIEDGLALDFTSPDGVPPVSVSGPVSIAPLPVPMPVPVPVPVPSVPAPSIYRDTPLSPPHTMSAPPPPPTIVPVYAHNTQDMPSADVDHRGILPPPPPPPVLPSLGNIEDVDHRLLPSLPPPPPVPPVTRHSLTHQDVDHRNLISLTHQPRPSLNTEPRPMAPPKLDQVSSQVVSKPLGLVNLPMTFEESLCPIPQDYRVTPAVPPSDIVESVDMDLSEDEDQQGMYPNEHRRNSFNNNKVLVGGDNGRTNRVENHRDNEVPNHSIPPPPQPPTNPFENLPPELKNLNIPFNELPPFPLELEKDDFTEDSAFDDDIRSRQLDHAMERHPTEFEDSDWHGPTRPFDNQRFPRNWRPRSNFRPPFMGPRRGGPIGPMGSRPQRWNAPRPRFW